MPSPRPIAEAMEERILHSADVAPLLLASEVADTLVQQPTTEVSAQSSEIVFVDANLPDAHSLLADLQAQQRAGRPIEIITISANDDGVSLISATLASRSDITAVHVLTHGSDGVLQIGNVRLDAQTLLQRAGEVAGWGAALTIDADLLLYGCDLAQTV
ncbi:MAG: DUF4347 domain-containing protein, partial [Burkholderiaceae bacterium]|nr:DUF4347 domain-containing protein [Burkholderiaceae bacterium]